jgi:uncharacterized protein (TIGR03435 family)
MKSPCRLPSAVAVVVLFRAASLSAQAAPDPPRIAFEVASIRPNGSRDATESVSLQPGGGLRMTGFRLHTLIRVAYAIGTTLTPEQVVGGPAWISSDRFDIVAKAEGDLMFDVEGRRPARVIAMLKTLIEDRFAVRVHPDSRKMPAFALRMSRRDGKLGPQLNKSTSDCPRYVPGAAAAPSDSERWCGFRRAPGSVMGRYVTMQEVATFFSGYPVVGRPVQDRTGLTGRYDLRVQFIEGPEADSGSFFTALAEQLGLAFQSERAIVPMIVIDHAERPTPD